MHKIQDEKEFTERVAIDRAIQSLKLVSTGLPHLSGLVRLLRLKATDRVSVAAVGASGLVLVNPTVFTHISLAEAAFVMAHELMHLALDTHGRAGDTDRLLVNYAHDYIINDMLREELERDPPLDGLDMPEARHVSLEAMILQLSVEDTSGMRCWNVGFGGTQAHRRRSALSFALEDAGLVEPSEEPIPTTPDILDGDVLPPEMEPEFEPEVSPELRKQLIQRARKEALRAASLAEWKARLEAAESTGISDNFERHTELMQAIRGAFSTPWEIVLQRWMDNVAPGGRTYARPSRRAGNRTDVVLPGRRREGWTLNIVMDTSGSMDKVLPKALGAIAVFCDANRVENVRIVQCDQSVTDDRMVEIEELSDFRVAGFGGSDMSPGMNRLADDPEVTGVLVLTDGYIYFPEQEPPYRILWAILGDENREFKPRYGEVIFVDIREPADRVNTFSFCRA